MKNLSQIFALLIIALGLCSIENYSQKLNDTLESNEMKPINMKNYKPELD